MIICISNSIEWKNENIVYPHLGMNVIIFPRIDSEL